MGLELDNDIRQSLRRTGLNPDALIDELTKNSTEQVNLDGVVRFLNDFAREECQEEGAENSLVDYETNIARYVLANAARQQNPTTSIAGEKVRPRGFKRSETPTALHLDRRKRIEDPRKDLAFNGMNFKSEQYPLRQRIEEFLNQLDQ